jgi:hypothetical protein
MNTSKLNYLQGGWFDFGKCTVKTFRFRFSSKFGASPLSEWPIHLMWQGLDVSFDHKC